MNAAELVVEARHRRGFTQRRLAELAGVTQAEIARIETGANRPRSDTLDRLLRASGFDLALVPRAGVGVDRSAMRRLLSLSPQERALLAVEEARNLDRLPTRGR